MALLHRATITPTKLEAVAGWLPDQPWAPAGDVTLVGAYRFDDPLGETGLETHLALVAGTVVQVPLTYRAEPLEGAEASLVCRMEHSALGTRWVYDAMADPAHLRMLAAATLTGVGQSVEIQVVDGVARTRPPTVRLGGGGWAGGLIEVDGWGAPEQDGDDTVVHSDAFELRLHRRPVPGGRPDGSLLMGTWAGQDEPAVLATAVPR